MDRRVTALALGAGVAAYVAWRLVRAWKAGELMARLMRNSIRSSSPPTTRFPPAIRRRIQ